MKVISFKAPEEHHERWKAEAHRLRITFGEWVRCKLNNDLPELPVVREAPHPKLVKVAVEKKTPKIVRCEHRLPPGTYCKFCQRIKK